MYSVLWAWFNFLLQVLGFSKSYNLNSVKIFQFISDVYKCGGVTKEKVSYFQVRFYLSCICFNAALIITPHHCVHRMKSFQPKHKQELSAAIFWRWVFIRQDNQCKVQLVRQGLSNDFPHFSRSPEMCVLSRLTFMSSL